ncbi:MAG: DUF3786 domain-containing protein [Candidatus Magnetomorum sp.]|nr:DUF3786 domain-containing protein [Candidatus Magnetomorum sp.]
MDILKLLKKNNCRDCNEKTCLAFAAAVHQGRKQLADCPHIAPELLEKYGATLPKIRSHEQEMQQTIDALKDKLAQIDLKQAAQNVQGHFSAPWLTLKLFGKDFRVDASGNLSSDIHINPWVVVPFLNHIIQATGAPLADKWVTFRELRGGQARFALYEQRFEKELKRIADNFTDVFEDLIHIFNGRQLESDHQHPSDPMNRADISLVLYPFPKIPLLIQYWKPEDDLGSNITLFFDEKVHEQLDTESLYGLLSGLLQMFYRLAMRHGI